MVLDESNGLDQVGEPFQCVVLALDRDEHGVRSGERIHCQETERRRTVQEDLVVGIPDRIEQAPQAPFALMLDARELHLGARELGRGRDQSETIDGGRDHELREISPLHDQLVGRRSNGRAIDSEAARRIGLGVEIDDEDPIACSCQ